MTASICDSASSRITIYDMNDCRIGTQNKVNSTWISDGVMNTVVSFRDIMRSRSRVDGVRVTEVSETNVRSSSSSQTLVHTCAFFFRNILAKATLCAKPPETFVPWECNCMLNSGWRRNEDVDFDVDVDADVELGVDGEDKPCSRSTSFKDAKRLST